MEGQPLSHYYISSAPGAGHNYPQVKDGSRPPQPGSSAAPHAAPPSGSGSHHGSFSPALAYPSSTRWAGGNAQGSGLNPPPPPPPPPHYALPHGPVVYLHGGGASAASADPRSMMLGSPAAMNMNILPTSGPMLYPAMQMQPTTAAGSAVAYYLPAEATACPSPQYGNVAMAAPTSHGFYLFQHHQQQQQQHSTLLNTASSAPNTATAAGPGASFPYLVLPTQQVDPNNMSSLSSFTSLPSSMAYPTSLAPQVAPAASHMMAYMQHQQRQATPLSGMGVPPYAQPPPPLHTFAAHSSGVDEGQHTAPPPPSAAPHVQGRRGEAEAHALTSLTPLGLPTAAAKKAAKASSGGGSGNGGGASKWRRSSHSVDSCSLNREASAVSQSLLSAQGLPYAEDPVEIDTTKRQLIVNYLPQRLTDERFRDLFRPYGELMEEESHIIYDFRHHKMVPVSITLPPPPMTTTDVPPSMDGALRTASSHASNLVDNTVSDVVKDAAPSSATTTQSTANLASGGTAASEDAALMSGVDGAVGTTVAATRSMPRSKGYGFIYYKDGASTERAIKELNGMEVDGKRIKVRYAEQQRSVDVPTACGGGDDGDAAKAAEVQLCNVAIDSDRSGDDEEEEELFNIEAFKMEDE